MIRKCHNLVRGQKVINHLNALLRKSSWGRYAQEGCYYSTFNAGRESGYTLRGFNLHITFCEHSSSDNIVVYSGGEHDFYDGKISVDKIDNITTEHFTYSKRRKKSQEERAAEYMFKLVVKDMKDYKKFLEEHNIKLGA